MPFSFDQRAVWAGYAAARNALAHVTERLGASGTDIPVLAVKGIVTSGWLYADTAERPLSDLDVRLRPRDFRSALRAIADAGWTVGRLVWSYRNVVFVVNGVTVDLECDVGPPGVCALTIPRLLERATRDPAGFWVPDAYDHAVLLTLNVFKDKLRWAMPWAIEDVLRVVNLPGFDRTRFVERLHEAGVVGPAWVVADWAARTHGSEAWRALRDRLGGDAPQRRLFTRLASRLFAEDDLVALPARVLSRTASDDPRRWPSALARAAVWELESRWDARRRGTPRRWYDLARARRDKADGDPPTR